MRHRRAGFTLVEAMVTIAIIAVLAAVSAPALLGAMPGLRVNGAARQVLSDFRLARTTAIERGRPVVFEFSTGGDYRLFIDANSNGSYDAGEVVVKTVDIDGSSYYKGVAYGSAHATGVELGLAPPATTTVSFRVNGSVSTSGSVYLNAGAAADRHRRVSIIAATGNTRIERYEGGTWN